MNILSKKEKALAREIIDAGYQSAARSFSQVIQQNIEIEITEIEATQSEPNYKQLLKSGADITMLTTRIIGEVSGKSFLLLNEEERQAIFSACLGPQKDEAQRKVMEEAILKEIDNIISATVITQFSNTLGFSIYGGVPEMIKLKSDEVDSIIKQELDHEPECLLTIDTRFHFENNTELQPYFFWVLSEKFLYEIRNIAQ